MDGQTVPKIATLRSSPGELNVTPGWQSRLRHIPILSVREEIIVLKLQHVQRALWSSTGFPSTWWIKSPFTDAVSASLSSSFTLSKSSWNKSLLPGYFLYTGIVRHHLISQNVGGLILSIATSSRKLVVSLCGEEWNQMNQALLIYSTFLYCYSSFILAVEQKRRQTSWYTQRSIIRLLRHFIPEVFSPPILVCWEPVIQ